MRTYFKRYFPVIMLLLAPVASFAADAAAPVAAKGSFSFNPLLVGLVSLVIVLLFVIGVAANVLRQLAQVWREKNIQEQSQKTSTVTKAVLLLLLATMGGYTAMAADEAAAPPALNWNQIMISGIPAFDYYFLLGVIALELVVIGALLLYIRIFVRMLNETPETAAVAEKIVKVPFWDRINKTVAIEKEKDILLHHDYDGIQELDNSLPPWWKYGFYLTIVVAVIYLWRFHVSGDGLNPEQEYAVEMKQAEEDKAAYLAQSANNIDENTITMLADPAEIAAGRAIFETTCAPCHAKDGGGVVGPNLTDDYWLHGGSVKDVFKSIKYGWQDKGMKSWKDDFSPKQIAQLASFVKSLKGSKPAVSKEKQGELYKEEGGSAAADSTSSTVAAK